MTDPSTMNAMYQSRIDEYEQRARSTGNLVYVWMAICQAHAGGLPMPEWCHGQITYWAVRLYEIANLLDPDRKFERMEGEDEDAYSERLHERWAKTELSPETALAKAKDTFGFSKQGWNAFRAVIIDESAIRESAIQEAERHMPPEFKSRMAKPLMETEGRQRRRRIQAAKKLRSTSKTDFGQT